LAFLKEELPEIMSRAPDEEVEKAGVEGMMATKTSVFGEAEVEVDDIAAW
jgi:homoserine O-acetyltransferase